MTDPRDSCPEGWDPAELLAYLEGALNPDDVRILEEHLRNCDLCSVELESLRKVDLLLRSYPDSFHPDKEELYRLASTGEDAQGHVESHVRSCPTCGEELEILREMIALRESRDVAFVKLPTALAQEFERIHGVKGPRDKGEGGLRAWLRRFLEIPNSLPIMTLGTAAAVLIIAVFAVPLWKSYVEQPIPHTTAVPSAPAPKPAELPIPAEKAAPEEERAPLGSSQDLRKDKRPEKSDLGRALEAGSKQSEGKLEATKSNQPATVEGLMQREAPAKIGRSLKEKDSRAAGSPSAPQRKGSAEVVPPGSLPASQLESRVGRDKVSRIGEVDRQKLEKKTDERKAVAGLADATTKTLIEVRIVDSQGRDVEGITFVSPEDWRFAFRRGTVEDEKDKGPATSNQHPAAPKDRKVGARIIIRVTGEGADYDLEGQLFSGDSVAPEKTAKIERVTKDDLTRSIQDLLASLIAGRRDHEPDVSNN